MSGPATACVLEDFLGGLTQGPGTPASRRRSQRQSVCGPVLLGVAVGEEQSFKPLYRTWATDLSPLGIGLLTEHQLPTQMAMIANLEPLVGQPCVMGLRIIFCKQILSHTYRVGGAFILDEESRDSLLAAEILAEAAALRKTTEAAVCDK